MQVAKQLKIPSQCKLTTAATFRSVFEIFCCEKKGYKKHTETNSFQKKEISSQKVRSRPKSRG